MSNHRFYDKHTIMKHFICVEITPHYSGSKCLYCKRKNKMCLDTNNYDRILIEDIYNNCKKFFSILRSITNINLKKYTV